MVMGESMNGERLRSGPLNTAGEREELRADGYSQCVHCGFCLEVCPTYQELSDETQSPRGRVFLIKQVADGHLPLEAAEDPIFACLDCRACETVCPSGVPVGHLIEEARGQIVREREGNQGAAWRENLVLRGLFMHPMRLRLAGGVLRFYQRSGLQKIARQSGLTRWLPEHLTDLEASLPQVSARLSRVSLEHQATGMSGREPVRVAFF
jgi:glycolate oxidase iron-sulfur subunit